tara:strand:- start:1147 stop:2868 length:1722 start_codon:yes stop_codon:yes gene_type:complete
MKLKLIYFFCILLNFFFGTSSYSQVLLPGDADTSRLRPPRLPLPATPKFDLRIESPERSPVPKAVDDITFEVKGIDVDGAEYYPKSEIDKIFSNLIEKKISLSELREATEILEKKYKDDNFFLVRVLIPPQEVEDGIFKIKVIEGYINKVFIDGGKKNSRKKILSIIKKLENKKPIDLPALERALLLLNDLPGISGNGVLRQGSEVGSSELLVTINPPPPTSYLLTLNNGASKTMGQYSTNINATYNNPDYPSSVSMGFSSALKNDDDQLFNPILKAFNGTYSTSLGDDGLIFSLGALFANAKPQGSLKSLGILSKSYSVAPRLRYPVKRSRNESYYIEGGLNVARSETFLLDSSTTKDKLTVADLVFSVTNDIWFGGRTQLNFTVAQGLDLFGSRGESTSLPGPSVSNFKQTFSKYKFTGNHTLPIKKINGSLKLNAQAQWTNDKLLAGEQITFGGPAIGRGYDGGVIAGDKGFGLSVELSKRLTKKTMLGIDLINFELFVFIDYAEARILSEPISGILAKNSYMGSHGIGARLSEKSGLMFDLTIARARNEKPSQDARRNPRVIMSLTKPF